MTTAAIGDTKAMATMSDATGQIVCTIYRAGVSYAAPIPGRMQITAVVNGQTFVWPAVPGTPLPDGYLSTNPPSATGSTPEAARQNAVDVYAIAGDIAHNSWAIFVSANVLALFNQLKAAGQ